MGKVGGGRGFWMAFPQKTNLHNAHREHLKSLALPMGISSLATATYRPKALALGSHFHLSFPSPAAYAQSLCSMKELCASAAHP